MELIFLFVIAIVSILALLAQQKLHQNEKKDIFDRFMARDFREYKYLKDEFPIELEGKKHEIEERMNQPELTGEQKKMQEVSKRY